jgi:hypothetical protein
MDVMDVDNSHWITIAGYENLPGNPAPLDAVRA